jgi:hypothetical protein
MGRLSSGNLKEEKVVTNSIASYHVDISGLPETAGTVATVLDLA